MACLASTPAEHVRLRVAEVWCDGEFRGQRAMLGSATSFYNRSIRRALAVVHETDRRGGRTGPRSRWSWLSARAAPASRRRPR